MTHNENIQRIKNETLNQIKKIYHPLYKFPYNEPRWGESSYGEQREQHISYLIEKMNKRIEKIKQNLVYAKAKTDKRTKNS